MGVIASSITSLTIVYSTVYAGADQRKYQSSASLGFVRGIHQRPVNSPHKWPVTRKMFLFDDVIMLPLCYTWRAIVWFNDPNMKICNGIALNNVLIIEMKNIHKRQDIKPMKVFENALRSQYKFLNDCCPVHVNFAHLSGLSSMFSCWAVRRHI